MIVRHGAEIMIGWSRVSRVDVAHTKMNSEVKAKSKYNIETKNNAATVHTIKSFFVLPVRSACDAQNIDPKKFINGGIANIIPIWEPKIWI